MLIIPVPEKFTRRNLPLVTVALILINCFVFFAFQWNDDARYADAQAYYFATDLAEIELTAYRAYSRGADAEGFPPIGIAEMPAQEVGPLYAKMLDDDEFQRMLHDGAIITPAHSRYPQWRQLRDGYNELLAEVTAISLGFVPAEARPATFLTYMFMHGSSGHLIGNMLFLFLAGVILEMGCGRLLSGASYLVTGLGAVGLYWLIHRYSLTPLVGASGAIAGLMGALTALYGRKKIKMFVYLGFYFHYRRVPAIWLLPPWVGLELYRLLFNGGGNVAYVAHLGGLVTGAAIGFVMSRLLKEREMETFTPEAADAVAPLIDQAMERIRLLELDAGAELLEQALAQQPDHVVALTHLFNLRKNDPATDGFHEIASRLLTRLTRDAVHYEQAQAVYEEYLSAARPPRLAPELYLQMSVILAGLGQPDKAERIITLFLKQKPNYPGIPSALLALAKEYRQERNRRKYQTCLRLLQTRYPASAEGQTAAEQISKASHSAERTAHRA